jgi:MarR family transcriptional regulator, negative regulator of the multidrug operon emrRAB
MSSSSSSPRADPELARLANLLGAWSLAMTDRIAAGAATAAGRGGQAPAALVALDQFAEGSTIEQLSDVLALTHSATVRLIDALVADGHVVRRRRPGDRRAVAVSLTASGRAAARSITRARAEAVRGALGGLSEAQRRSLTAMAERLTAEMTALRLEERAVGTPPAGGWLCRLCDFQACGRPEGRCPAAATARAGSLAV